MKIVITQEDFQQAIVAHLAQFNISVTPEQLDIDIDEIEINLNPETESDTDSPKPKRKRRTKAEIEADEAKAKMNPVYETTDPVPTQTLAAAIEPVVQAQETVKPTTESLFEPDWNEGENEESLGSIVDGLEEAAAKPKEPESIFG